MISEGSAPAVLPGGAGRVPDQDCVDLGVGSGVGTGVSGGICGLGWRAGGAPVPCVSSMAPDILRCHFCKDGIRPFNFGEASPSV